MRHRHSHRHHPFRLHPRPVHTRAGGHRPAVLRRPDLLRRRRHARRSRTPRLHPAPVRARARGRVPGPQRRAARPRGRALPAAPRTVRGGRRRPAHLRLATCRPARHPRVPPPHAAQAVVGHVHAVHQLPLLARGRRDRGAARGQQRGARGQGYPPARRRAGRRGALRRRAGVAGARPDDLRLPARGEGASLLRLARPGGALPLPLAAAARGARARRRATSRGHRRSAAACSRTRRRACCAHTWTWCARPASCPPPSLPDCSTGPFVA